MTRTEHLLWIVAEECAEVAQRVSKAARFGLKEVQPGQPLSNAERIVQEFDDLLAVVVMLKDEGCLPASGGKAALLAKKAKVEKFLRYSAECGTLET
jgi:NTP pyrophosphatase (non-canonical NTP hydrolase)